MKFNLLFSVCSATAALFFSANAAVDQAKINAVMKGEIKEAKASWWGFDPSDSTKALQAAINSKVPRLIIDKQFSPWIAGPLTGVADQTIIFEDGVELQAKRGSFTGRLDCQITFRGVKNVAVIGLGHGGMMRMHKKDYQNKNLYSPSEWRHCILMDDVVNGRVENMKLCSSGGDGIEINDIKDIVLKNIICDDNHRQGLSIISGENILVENSQFTNTRGTSPQSGVDIEPFRPNISKLRNIVFRNCLFSGNARWGVLIAVSSTYFNSEKCGKMDIHFENCEMKDNDAGEVYFFSRRIFNEEEVVAGNVEFINCTAKTEKDCDRRPVVEFSTELHHKIDVMLKNFTISRGSNKAEALRFVFSHPQRADSTPSSKIVLHNVKFSDTAGKDMLKIIDNSFSGKTEYISGTVMDEKGKTIDLNPQFVKGIMTGKAPEKCNDYSRYPVKMSVATDGTMEKYPEFFLNKEGIFWLNANAEKEVAFELKSVKSDRPKETEVKLIAPDGKVSSFGILKPGETKVFKFISRVKGIYKVKLALKDIFLQVALTRSNVPAGIMLNDYEHHVRKSSGTLYFYVPVGTPQISLRVWCESFSKWYSGVAVTVRDPGNKVAYLCRNASDGASFTASGSEVKKGGIWQVSFQAPNDSQYIFYSYNIRMMEVSPYVGLRADRTPVLE